MHTLIIILLLIFTTPLHSEPAKSGETEVKESPIPNPLELEKEWWKYFETSGDELQNRINSFNKNLETLFPLSDQTEHQKLEKIKEEILFNLKLYEKKVNQIVPQTPPPLQFLKEYTPGQLLEINQRLLRTKNAITQLQDRIEFQQGRLSRIQSELDKRILQYVKLSGSSYERLRTGLKILELRTEAAIYQTEINHFKQELSYRQKERDLLIDELKTAKDRVTYAELTRHELEENLNQTRKEIDDAQKKLDLLERKKLRTEPEKLKEDLLCCLLNYEIITQTIRFENFELKALINDIKLSLFSITQEKPEESAKINDRIAKWEKTLAKVKKSYKQWQTQLENDHAQVSKRIAERLKDEEEGKLPDEKTIAAIHLEIDQSVALLDEILSNTEAAELLIKLVQDKYVEEKSITETWWIRVKSYWNTLISTFKEKTSVTLFYVNEHPVTLATLLKSIFTIIFAFIFSKYLRKGLSKKIFVSRRRFSQSTQYIILRLLHYVLIIIAFLIALSFIGIDMTNLAIVAGALGVGIGFGLQTMVNNILSGFTLLLNRYLKVGDVVEMQGKTLATVKAVNLQFTHICTFDGADQIIPNSELSTKGLTNWTMQNSFRRFRIPFGVAYGTDKEQLQKVILEEVKKQTFVISGRSLFPDPQIWFMEYGESWMNFELVAWVDLNIPPPYGIASSSLLWIIDNVLAANEIKIPYPQQDIHIKDLPEWVERK